MGASTGTSKINWRTWEFGALAKVLIATVLLRVIWALIIAPLPVSDGHAYDLLAQNLLWTGTYGWAVDRPSAYWPPGTAALYASMFHAIAMSPEVIAGLNVLLSSSIIVLSFILARMFFSERVALLTALILCVWPAQIAFVSLYASELPFTVLLLTALVFWYRPTRRPYLTAIIAGGLLGAATYFRSVAMLLPLVLWLTVGPQTQSMRCRCSRSAIAFFVILLVLSPWTLRNANVFHHFIPLTTSDGVNLWMGNNPDATGLYMPTPHDTEGLGEYEQNRLLGNRAREFILSHPVGFGVRTVKKALLFFRGDTIGAHWNAASLERAFGSGSVTVVKVVMQAYWAFVLCLAVLGFGIFGARVGVKPAAMNPCTVVLAYFTVLYAAIVVSDRYHFPLDPFLGMFTAIAVDVFIQKRALGAREAQPQTT